MQQQRINMRMEDKVVTVLNTWCASEVPVTSLLFMLFCLISLLQIVKSSANINKSTRLIDFYVKTFFQGT